VKPNYFYLSRPELIYEHTALFKKYLDGFVVQSNQSSFSSNKITLYILNATFDSFSTVQPVNLIFEPVSYGGVNHYNSITISFESYSEQTAAWWENTLSGLGFTVQRNGDTITLNANDVDVTINYIVVHATTAGETTGGYTTSPTSLVNLSEQSYNVYEGVSIPLGVRVIDEFGNPVRGAEVTIDTGSGTVIKESDENGEVWYIYNAASAGTYSVTFSIPGDSYSYDISVASRPSGGGIFDLSWNVSSPYGWNVSLLGAYRSFGVTVTYEGNPVSNARVDFSTDAPNLISVVDNYAYTDTNGNAAVDVIAWDNGTANLIATSGGSSAVLQLDITGAGGGVCPPGWSYRRVITINNPGSALTEYQVRVELDNTNFDFTKAKPDGSDIRFTDTNGVFLSYWIEEWSSNHAVIWVRVPNIPSGLKTIYMYYGNPSATTESNGAATFDFFDDFDTDTSSNYVLWESWVGSPSFIWDTVNSELRTDTSNADFFLTTTISLSSNFIVEIKAYTQDNDAIGALIRTNGGVYYVATLRVTDYDGAGSGGSSETLIRYDGVPSYYWQATRLLDFGDVINPSNWQIGGIAYDGEKLYAYYDHQKQLTSYSVGSISVHSVGLSTQANSPPAHYDWILVRKYAPQEPNVSVGSEELC
jgi:uncharacterized GH25 family protein